MSEQERNKAVVERFIEEYYRRGNLDVFDEILAPDFVFSGVGAEVRGDVDELKRVASSTHAMIHDAFPDIRFTIEEMIAEGGSVCVRLRESGTMTGPYVAGQVRIEPSGRSIDVTAMEAFRLRDSRILRRWAVRDRLGALQQMGATVSIE